MPILLYAFFVLVLVIVYYGYPKRDTDAEQAKEEVQLTYRVEVPEVSIHRFNHETESFFLLRCRNHIKPMLERLRLAHEEIKDCGWFLIAGMYYKRPVTESLFIKPIHDKLLKRIIFETKFETLKIPDHKLEAVAELIHRINNKLTITGFGLDYSSKVVTFRSTLLLGNREIDRDQLKLYNETILRANNILPFMERIINDSEEPELVAIDYLSTDTYQV